MIKVIFSTEKFEYTQEFPTIEAAFTVIQCFMANYAGPETFTKIYVKN